MRCTFFALSGLRSTRETTTILTEAFFWHAGKRDISTKMFIIYRRPVLICTIHMLCTFRRDRQNLCAKVKSGEGRVYKCLMSNKMVRKEAR